MTVLTTPDEKEPLLEEAAGARAVALDFKQVRNQTPEEFFEILLTRYQMGGLLIGKDFAFGKDRAGTAGWLQTACARREIPFEMSDF